MTPTNMPNRCGFMPKMHSRPRSLGFGGSFLKTAHAGVKAHSIRLGPRTTIPPQARTITVDGVRLPAPETEAPAYGTKIYFINPFNRSVVESCWSGDATEHIDVPKERPNLHSS